MKNNDQILLGEMSSMENDLAKQDKITMLESMSQTSNDAVVRKIISLLNDPDIEIRGEAFGALMLNKNDISAALVDSLNDEESNVRAFCALILGNRKTQCAINPLKKLTRDDRAMVRSCALGALGYLKAIQAEMEIRHCFTDKNMEVKRSALKAAIDIDYNMTGHELENFSNENDEELGKLISIASQKNDLLK